jgi:glycosyltransferase involved in cell wall biosynthesis
MKVSVIVPVRDEEQSIRELLDSLLQQTRPPDEIVIADGGSIDATPQIIEQYIKQGAPVRLLRAGPALPGRGRNVGAAAAKFDWLAFTDAGIRLDRDWLENLIARAEQDEAIELVYGSWEPIIDSFFKECAAIAYVPPPLTVSNGVVMRPRAVVSMLLRRDAWAKVAGFPEDLRSAEDLLFMNRLEATGYRAVFEPRAQVHWNLRATLADTFKRFVIYSRNNIRAGLWRQWQATILTRYAVLLVLLLAALLIDPRWVWVPILAWLLMLALRAFVSIRRNRHCYPASFLRNLARAVLIMCVLAALDAAAIIGSVQWLCFDAFRSPRTKTLEAGNGA